MKKVILSIVGLLLLVVIGYFVDPNFKSQVNGLVGKTDKPVFAQQSAPTPSTQQNSSVNLDQIVVSVQNPSKPFFYSSSGRNSGFNVDFLNLMAKQYPFNGNTKFKFVESTSYADVPKKLLQDNGVNIAIDGLTFNDDDLPGVKYTTSYVKDFGYSLIVANTNTSNRVEDFSGAKIGILAGDPDVRAFVENAFPSSKIVELSDEADANGKWIVGHIYTGKVDAVVYDYPFAVAEVENTNLKFAITKIKGSDIEYRIGVRADDVNMMKTLNTAIAATVKTDEYSALLKKYFMSTNVASVRRASSGEFSYVVAVGDTLGSIAKTQMGDQKKYVEIQSRNNLANPNFIAVGQKLIIPQK